MSQSVNDVFATFPQVVCAHFHSHRMQTLDRLQGTGIILEFRSEVGSRGPGTIRVVMRSEHFSSFSPETLYTGGSCFVFNHIFHVSSVLTVDEMFMRLEAVLASLHPLYLDVNLAHRDNRFED